MEIAVIGSGPGGMTAAKRLTDDGFNVTLFEKGPYLTQQAGPVPYSVAEMDTKYTDKGITVALGRANVNYVEGSCLGGGSEVNAGLYHRTPKKILEDWRVTYGIEFAEESKLEEHFKLNETILNVGLMPFPAPAASQKIYDGAKKLGWECSEAPRWYKYTSDSDKGIFSGVRQSMTEAVLPAINKANLKIIYNTNVSKIWEINSQKVVVEFSNETSTKKITKDFNAIFISCGAVGTPHLLKKSKLGPKHVGKNLKLHTSIKATARFPDKVNGIGAGIPVHQVKEFAPDFSIGGAISNLPFLAAGLSDNGVNPLQLSSNWHHYATYYSAITLGEGKVISLPFVDKPLVMFDVGKDGLELLTKALKKLCELLFAAGAIEVFPSLKNFSSLSSLEDIKKLPSTIDPKQASLMTIHMMGTCPIGTTNKSCVDLSGKLKGTNNIYITDASIIPTALGVNPQGTIMALSSFIASKFCERNLK